MIDHRRTVRNNGENEKSCKCSEAIVTFTARWNSTNPGYQFPIQDAEGCWMMPDSPIDKYIIDYTLMVAAPAPTDSTLESLSFTHNGIVNHHMIHSLWEEHSQMVASSHQAITGLAQTISQVAAHLNKPPYHPQKPKHGHKSQGTYVGTYQLRPGTYAPVGFPTSNTHYGIGHNQYPGPYNPSAQHWLFHKKKSRKCSKTVARNMLLDSATPPIPGKAHSLVVNQVPASTLMANILL